MSEFALQPGTRLCDGRYEVIKSLGRGGFSFVYLCKDASNDQDVAVKELFMIGCIRKGIMVQPAEELDEEEFRKFREGFLIESGFLSQFREEPSIVNIFDIFEENNTAYMVMEYFNGGTLIDLIKYKHKGDGLPEKDALCYITQIAQALNAIHSKGGSHYGVRPDNIFLNDEGRAVLLDSNVSFVKHCEPFYPIEGDYSQLDLTPYAAVYSLAATLYYLLTGLIPQTLCLRLESDLLRTLDTAYQNISQKTCDAVTWAMQMKPEDRPQTVDEFLNALRGEE